MEIETCAFASIPGDDRIVNLKALVSENATSVKEGGVTDDRAVLNNGESVVVIDSATVAIGCVSADGAVANRVDCVVSRDIDSAGKIAR